MSKEIIQQQPKQDLALNFVEQIRSGWEKVLPAVCTPERFARVALSCLKKDNKLMAAIQTKEGKLSISQAFMKCAELGIEPDGRRAYLIPYKNDIQLIIDYKGIAELAMRSGFVSNIHADKVCENDEFEYNIGNIEKHRIDFKNPRGNAYAYYAIVTFKDGTKKCEVMNVAEVDAIKERSAAWGAYLKYNKICPWNTDYDEMAKKTVFKRLAKWIPQSPELRSAVEFDDEDYRSNTSSSSDVILGQSAGLNRESPAFVDADYTALDLDETPQPQENADISKADDALEAALESAWQETIPA